MEAQPVPEEPMVPEGGCVFVSCDVSGQASDQVAPIVCLRNMSS
jgi:hypothetical protein